MKSTIFTIVLLALGFFPEQSSAQLQKVADKPKSPGKALALSLVPTLASMFAGGVIFEIAQNDKTDRNTLEYVGIGLWSAGVVFGPSLGYSYTKDSSKASRGIAIRAGLLTSSLLLAAFQRFRHNRGNSSELAGIFIVILQVTALSYALDDILNVKKSARKYNRQNNLARIPRIQLTPIYLANHKTPGLGVRFTL